MFPVAYMSEPGFWTMNEAEDAGLRTYLHKGGFIIFDDFRGNHIAQPRGQMRQVLPGRAVPEARRDASDLPLVLRDQRARSSVRLLRDGGRHRVAAASSKTTTRESD